MNTVKTEGLSLLTLSCSHTTKAIPAVLRASELAESIAMYVQCKLLRSNEKGNLSLEHILFIVAVAGISTAVSAFYGDIASWFEGISLPSSPSIQ